MIMADNGSSMYLSGAPNNNWNNDDLHTLSQVPASAFEVIQMSPVYTSSNVPVGAAPMISSFTATAPTISTGGTTSLSWIVTDASYVIISPGIGAMRESSVSVSPRHTTQYTLYATNQFGRRTAVVTVTVQ
jgi:hypothetical protein